MESSFQVDALTEDRLEQWFVRGKEGAGISPNSRKLAKELSRSGTIQARIKAANTLTEIERAGDSIPTGKTHHDVLESNFKEKRQELGRNLYSNVGLSGAGLNRVIDILEKNDYDTNRIKYHSYQVRGKTRIGIFEVGKAGFITNISTQPAQIKEGTPNFSFPED